MDKELSKRTAAEVKNFWQTMVVFVKDITPVNTNTKRPWYFYQSHYCHLSAAYLWREFEVVRRRLPTAFLTSVTSKGALTGVGGLLPSRAEFALAD